MKPAFITVAHNKNYNFSDEDDALLKFHRKETKK